MLISEYPPPMSAFLPRRSMSIPCETHSMSQDQEDSLGKHCVSESDLLLDIISYFLSNPHASQYLCLCLTVICPILVLLFPLKYINIRLLFYTLLDNKAALYYSNALSYPNFRQTRKCLC